MAQGGSDMAGDGISAEAVCRWGEKLDSGEVEVAWSGPKASLGLEEGGRSSGSVNAGVEVARRMQSEARR